MKTYRTRTPDFNQLIKVLSREKTPFPVLFEIFMDSEYYTFFSGKDISKVEHGSIEQIKTIIDAFHNAGYCYASVHGSEFRFPAKAREHKDSISLNDGGIIHDEESFKSYNWVDPESCDYSNLAAAKDILPDGMKLVVLGPGGVLENVTSLIGYEDLCYMVYETPELLEQVFNNVGSRLLRYYELSLEFDTVGAIVSNDDWGFNTQTFLSTEHMRKYVFPWHKKIVEAAHKKGRKAILHSCGCMNEVFEDIINDMKFDAKHSYEDNILSVEDSYARYGNRIAILGGLDLDFLIQSPTEKVLERATALARLGVEKGGYALGTGNSMCDYVPEDKALTLINVANQWELR